MHRVPLANGAVTYDAAAPPNTTVARGADVTGLQGNISASTVSG
jgi:hypothetical protein